MHCCLFDFQFRRTKYACGLIATVSSFTKSPEYRSDRPPKLYSRWVSFARMLFVVELTASVSFVRKWSKKSLPGEKNAFLKGK